MFMGRAHLSVPKTLEQENIIRVEFVVLIMFQWQS